MIYICDTETNGREPAEVIELATMGLEADFASPFEPVSRRFKPVHPSTYGALAIHHILPEELEGEVPSATVQEYLPTDLRYLIGHNVDYDWNALGCPPCSRICTLAMSRAIYPEGEHSLGAMTYKFSQDMVATRARLRKAHGAAVDVQLTYELLINLMIVAEFQGDIEALWKYSEACRIPTVWTFGKYKDQAIMGSDKGYMQWCLKQPDMDEYVKAACKRALGW